MNLRSSSVAPDALVTGTRVGDYTIDELRSEGGFALLYRARTASGDAVALKVLRRELAFHGGAVQRFHREIEALRQLSHPNVVRIHGHGDLPDGRPWLAMEWLDGGDLAQHLRDVGALSLAECVAITVPLADALERAHGIGLVHRDLKAENVMVRREDGALVPTLVDFGIAHWSAREPGGGGKGLTSHSVIGSPCSMAPEQILGEPVDARTDVYALGVLLFQMATGALPYRSLDPIELEEMHLVGDPPLASTFAPVSLGFDALVRACMAKAPASRPASAAQVATSLREAVAGEPAIATLGAVHVEALRDEAIDDEDDAAFDDEGALLALARRTLITAGLAVSDVQANAVLGIGDAQRVCDLAETLAAALETRTTKHRHVRSCVTAHVATRDDLRRTGAWVGRVPGTWLSESARATRSRRVGGP